MPASGKQRACIWPWETAQPYRPAGAQKRSNLVRRQLRSQSISTYACQLQTLRSTADLCSNFHQMSTRRSSMPAVSQVSAQNSKNLECCCSSAQCKTNIHVLSEPLTRRSIKSHSLCSSSTSTAMVACDSPAAYSSADTVSPRSRPNLRVHQVFVDCWLPLASKPGLYLHALPSSSHILLPVAVSVSRTQLTLSATMCQRH
jgi:hypothetical protein